VINETAARLLFGGAEPLGGRFAVGQTFPSRSTFEVVGVMQDHVFDAPREPIGPLAFIALAQERAVGPPRVMLRVANDRDGERVIASLRETLKEHAPEFSVLRVKPLSDLLRLSTRREHLLAWLSGAFGGLGLLLAGVGLYGVVAWSTKRRTYEIGIRIALGARPGQILRTVVRGAFMAVSAGIGIGLAATMVATRYVEAMLFGLTRNDPATMIAAVATLLLVGTVAAYVPGRSAARSDPLQALRHE
jgi:predicted lysophospholipase L1 biosynthesis ABC-type transport system permease subunit